MSESQKKYGFRLLIVLYITLTALTLTGCASSKVTVPVDQQNLLVKCPEMLPEVAGKNGNAWILMSKEWSYEYYSCAIRHNGLVDAIIGNKNKED